MKIALRSLANQQFVSADDTITVEYQGEPYSGGAPTRPLQAHKPRIGPWEELELLMQDAAGNWVPFAFPEPPVPVTPTPTPPVIERVDPIDGTWPPPATRPRVRPPDFATTNVTEVRRQLRWSLWVSNSSDDESYWMRVIVLNPEPGHTPGWTADTYWADRVEAGDGAGKGYRWPAT